MSSLLRPGSTASGRPATKSASARLASTVIAFIHTPLGAGLAMALWDFLGAVITYSIASASYLSVPAQTINNAFWVAAVGIVVSDRRPAMIVSILSGGALGTFAGILLIRALAR